MKEAVKSRPVVVSGSGVKPHLRSAGSGPTVLCLHSSASSSKQWRALTERLADRYRVVAPDLYGYGESPPWPAERRLSFDDEIELLAPLLESLGPLHLVGHSYGAAVALKLALAYPDRIRRLVIYEPVLFRLLAYANASRPMAREIFAVAVAVVEAVERGELEYAARQFVDYWSGEGSWHALAEEQRHTIAQRMRKVAYEFDAIGTDILPLSAYARVQAPTLYLYGTQAPRPTRTIAALLAGVLPRAVMQPLHGIGHMGPLSHAGLVNAHIERFLTGEGQLAATGRATGLRPRETVLTAG